MNIDSLKKNLKTNTTNYDARQKMAPGDRIIEREMDTTGMVEACVLIALYKENGIWKFPLIQRVEDGYAHSGQISFPGGRLDEGETLEDCAKREAFEEIGIETDALEMIGRLSPMPIPVSNYLVHPFIATLKEKPKWIPQENEVQEVLEIDLKDINDGNIINEKWDFGDRGMLNIPFYFINNKKVWGATAMILSEFSTLL